MFLFLHKSIAMGFCKSAAIVSLTAGVALMAEGLYTFNKIKKDEINKNRFTEIINSLAIVVNDTSEFVIRYRYVEGNKQYCSALMTEIDKSLRNKNKILVEPKKLFYLGLLISMISAHKLVQ